MEFLIGVIAATAGMLVLVPTILPLGLAGIGIPEAFQLSGAATALFGCGWFLVKAVRVARTMEIRRRRTLPDLKSLMF